MRDGCKFFRLDALPLDELSLDAPGWVALGLDALMRGVLAWFAPSLDAICLAAIRLETLRFDALSCLHIAGFT